MTDNVNLTPASNYKLNFPFAPEEWSESDAIRQAHDEDIILSPAHWELIQALQEYFAKHALTKVNIRELHDALEEDFHMYGGMKYLYILFPGGPVAQGGRFAGLQVPSGTVDKSFGSVQ